MWNYLDIYMQDILIVDWCKELFVCIGIHMRCNFRRLGKDRAL